MTPMLDARVAFLGVPADLLVLAIAVAGSIVGLVWLRRILTIEPETHSFRATAASSGRARIVITVGLILVAALLALASLGALRVG